MFIRFPEDIHECHWREFRAAAATPLGGSRPANILEALVASALQHNTL
jgi:hypothetical protein